MREPGLRQARIRVRGRPWGLIGAVVMALLSAVSAHNLMATTTRGASQAVPASRSAPAAARTPTGLAVQPAADSARPVRSRADPAAAYPEAGGPWRGEPPVVGWALQSWRAVPSAFANQGVATVLAAGGSERVLTRGAGSVPAGYRSAGWVHIGDPDSHAGYVLDAYQGIPGTAHKMFALTFANGSRRTYVHRLVAGEAYNNSFAAISPDGQWFVAGEWSAIRRLLVFAMPVLNHHAPDLGQNLPLATTVTLDRPMRYVQGCAFDTPVQLVCSTNDPSTTLYPLSRQLLLVRLARPLDGRPDTATTAVLGQVPQRSACPGPGETEGLDITGARLLLTVVEPRPCSSKTVIFTYTARGTM